MSKSQLCVAAITLFLLAGNAASPGQVYHVTDLGTLSGTFRSVGYGLNDAGQAAGLSSNPTAATATLFSNGKTFNINTLGDNVSLATAINGVGQAAGYNIFYNTPSTVFRAFLYSNGSMLDIHSPSLFPSGTIAYGINGAGEVVGQGQVNSYDFHVFLYSGGRMFDLGTLGGSQATGYAINESGEIAGSSTVRIVVSKNSVQEVQHAFHYANGKMTDLGLPAGATASGATAINGNGQIAGFFIVNNSAHAALFSNGVWTDLGTVAGAVSTQATGINLAGQVVGTAIFPITSYHPFKPGRRIGFIISNGAPVDLDRLIPANSGFTITGAVGINGSGDVLCNASVPGGAAHAVLLTPK